MIPYAYELKKIVAKNRQHFWCSAALTNLPTAPVYLFSDQDQFDSEAVRVLAQQNNKEPLRLPHDEVLFELPHWDSRVGAGVAFVRRIGELVEGFLFYRMQLGAQWTDVHCRAAFRENGIADVESNSRLDNAEEANRHAMALVDLVWRALGLLSHAAQLRDVPFPRTRRPKLARAGVSGWTWRMVDIDLVRVRAAARQAGGSHASPRWHIRRGHWRTLPDGHRVFVRSCEVGDPARGGVVKDYRVTMGEVA